MPGNKFRRVTSVGNPTCLLGFDGRGSVDSGVFDSTTLQPGGVDEIQTLTITGGPPTAGKINLNFRGQTSADIAYNATAAAIQTALRAMSRMGAGVVVGGGPLPGTPVTITFAGAKLGRQDQPLITVSGSTLNAGAVASVAETTKGDSTFAGLYVLRSGLPLMASADAKKLIEWDGASAATLVGIFDGQRELLGPGDDPVIPVYNHLAVFDIAVVKLYTARKANYDTWANAHNCAFKSQGT